MSDSQPPVSVTLTFSPTPSGANIRWEADAIGVRLSRFRAPYDQYELALVLRALDALQDPDYPVVWNEEQQQRFTFERDEQVTLARLGLWSEQGRVRPDCAMRVGRALCRALIEDAQGAQALSAVYNIALASAQRSRHETILALNLRFPPDAVALAALPWELLWDDSPLPLLLSRGGRVACTRHIDLPQALPPAVTPRAEPLRILAVSPNAGIAPELRQIERAARQAAWEPLVSRGLAVVEEVSPATRLELLHAVQRQPPDVVHFFGHGRYSDGQGALLLDGPDQRGNWTNAARLAALLDGVRLVVLHACQGAMVGGAGAADEAHAPGLLTGVAPALVAAGVPMAIGMQFTIRAAAATEISRAIYEALAAGRSVQYAVSQARRAIYITEEDQASWYVPVLYLRTRESGPVFLRAVEPVAEAPGVRPQATLAAEASQVVEARGPARVEGVVMRGGPGSDQQVSADGGNILDVLLRSLRPSRQRVAAEDGGVVRDVTLSDEPADEQSAIARS